MTWNSLNPALDSLLLKLLPLLLLGFLHLSCIFRRTFCSGLPFKPWPAWLNRIKIRWITAPMHPLYTFLFIHFFLKLIAITRSSIFLNNCVEQLLEPLLRRYSCQICTIIWQNLECQNIDDLDWKRHALRIHVISIVSAIHQHCAFRRSRHHRSTMYM